jgi:hypothetical protein
MLLFSASQAASHNHNNTLTEVAGASGNKLGLSVGALDEEPVTGASEGDSVGLIVVGSFVGGCVGSSVVIS